MKNNKYSAFVDAAWVSDGKPPDMQLAIAALGLVGEAGEVSEHIKKYLRGTHTLNVHEIELELGDVLYYVHKIANHLDLNVNEIMKENMIKLADRHFKKHGRVLVYRWKDEDEEVS